MTTKRRQYPRNPRRLRKSPRDLYSSIFSLLRAWGSSAGSAWNAMPGGCSSPSGNSATRPCGVRPGTTGTSWRRSMR